MKTTKGPWTIIIILMITVGSSFGCGSGGGDGGGGDPGGVNSGGPVTVLAYNDLGMHCMNQDFSRFMILPPFNNLHAEVIARTGDGPRIVTSGVQVNYRIPANTHSADKTNFWTYASQIFGVTLAPNVGLTGNGLAGTMIWSANNDWVATGIPVTPINDALELDPYNLATVSVSAGGTVVASTRSVVPVSWEISCDLCHPAAPTVADDIFAKHDLLHGTTLSARTSPFMCGECHAQAPLGTPGDPGTPPLSTAMHRAHSPRMATLPATVTETCYACHPGLQTKCFRDVHAMLKMTCEDCHVSMAAVGSPSRRPWVDLPRCENCHAFPGHQYEQPGKLYRDSRGHHGVHCEACHGSPHAIAPTIVAADSIQPIIWQGHGGTISDCGVCHVRPPEAAFHHVLNP
jgi:hypothetical protein